jgi:hypothetical protein
MKLKIVFISIALLFSVSIQSQANYTIKLTSNWSQETHPRPSGSLPSNAHWSRLVGATHNDQITFWDLSELATTGIKNIAEIGNNDQFFTEVNVAINNGFAGSIINGNSLATPLGEIIISDVILTQEFSIISLATMLAPSPDWFTGINNLSLIDTNNNWIDELIIDVYPNDAGTDSGSDYESSNMVTNPFQNISSLSGIIPFSNEKIATITFTLESVVATTNDFSLDQITVYPNPSNQEITISTKNNINKVFIYNYLGQEIFNLSNISTPSLKIDIGKFTNGIYFIKTNNSIGNKFIKI